MALVVDGVVQPVGVVHQLLTVQAVHACVVEAAGQRVEFARVGQVADDFEQVQLLRDRPQVEVGRDDQRDHRHPAVALGLVG